jgi:PilZ domain-containing protein
MQVALVEHVKFDERGRQIRGTGRLNSRVPVAIEGTETGQIVRAEGYTKDISTKGCMVIVPEGFSVGQKLRVINLINQSSSEAVLIWRGHEGPAGWELGIELQEAPADFWGLDF